METLIGIKEIAERLGYPVATVKVWRQRGRLPAPAMMIGRTPAWRWSSIRAWAQETGRWDKAVEKEGNE